MHRWRIDRAHRGMWHAVCVLVSHGRHSWRPSLERSTRNSHAGKLLRNEMFHLLSPLLLARLAKMAKDAVGPAGAALREDESARLAATEAMSCRADGRLLGRTKFWFIECLRDPQQRRLQRWRRGILPHANGERWRQHRRCHWWEERRRTSDRRHGRHRKHRSCCWRRLKPSSCICGRRRKEGHSLVAALWNPVVLLKVGSGDEALAVVRRPELRFGLGALRCEMLKSGRSSEATCRARTCLPLLKKLSEGCRNPSLCVEESVPHGERHGVVDVRQAVYNPPLAGLLLLGYWIIDQRQTGNRRRISARVPAGPG